MNDLKGIIEDCNKSDLVSDKIIKKIIEIIGQEEWQILHDENNDICTTMGELIITLKGIAELEKENAELKHTIAELRRDKDNLNTHTKAQEKLSEYRSEQLTKAKDLLLRFIELKNKPCASGHSINMLLYENICAETEQFLNSEVEK